MNPGRIVGAVVASATVAGCAVVVVGIARSGAKPPAAQPVQADRGTHGVHHRQRRQVPPTLPAASAVASHPAASSATRAATPSATAVANSAPAPAHTSIGPVPALVTRRSSTAPSTPTPSPPPTPHPSTTTYAPPPSSTSVSHAAPPPHPSTTPKPPPAQHPTTQPRTTPQPSAPPRGHPLPLRKKTGRATRVITVVASSTHSTTARLQAWRKAPGGGWLRVGRPTLAHVGSDGLSGSPSEYKSATPIGSFTLTQAFGHYANPGTRLHYFKTNSADWWISQAGPLYNTHRRCWSHCRFNQGSPNEHLYYETPFYNYAVVIDYNTRNTGHVRQGAGSAFFLHVTDGNPTAGCVSIAQSKLIRIMRWLKPRAHPRILIGLS
jgi:L,D-peptidoglycan transpeptidase YkuD (ErfK/YbiS/YcfS/YnhG family)